LGKGRVDYLWELSEDLSGLVNGFDKLQLQFSLGSPIADGNEEVEEQGKGYSLLKHPYIRPWYGLYMMDEGFGKVKNGWVVRKSLCSHGRLLCSMATEKNCMARRSFATMPFLATVIADEEGDSP
ncbi:hypothetical protein HAX54_016648, partial [Datura stramonium]|nr:hypothetical protein [Datura stramonium]